jgi:hypothetical protein
MDVDTPVFHTRGLSEGQVTTGGLSKRASFKKMRPAGMVLGLGVGASSGSGDEKGDGGGGGSGSPRRAVKRATK